METLSPWAQTIANQKYAQTKDDGSLETWEVIAERVAGNIVGPVFPELVAEVRELIVNRKFMPGGRYLYAAGRSFQAISNCYLLRAEDSREGWAKLSYDATHCLMSGGGIGVNYSRIRPRGATVGGLGGICTGPIALMEAVNETARQIQAGGSRRSAVYASLHWWHPDALEFVHLKDWDEHTTEAKARDFNSRAPMDMTNISIALDDEFFDIMDGKRESVTVTIGGKEYTADREWAEKVYNAVVANMLTTGEPGFQIDTGENRDMILRNACTEAVSDTHLDVCNLGSLNLARFDTLEEFPRAVALASIFLFCGSIVGEVANPESQAVRDRSHRLGLGLMGMYDWLVRRGYKYGPNEELGEWLSVYQQISDWTGERVAAILNEPVPVANRAIAPAGTISILAECTSGIEPLFATAYKRRYLKGTTWHYQYVIDSGAQRLVDEYGVDPRNLETAYDLAYTPMRRIEFQAWVQQYVDQAISSTLNLPSVTEHALDPEEFATQLYAYLPKLRGITVYPDGARMGQPLNVVTYTEAAASAGVEFEETGAENACVGGVCGI